MRWSVERWADAPVVGLRAGTEALQADAVGVDAEADEVGRDLRAVALRSPVLAASQVFGPVARIDPPGPVVVHELRGPADHHGPRREASDVEDVRPLVRRVRSRRADPGNQQPRVRSDLD